MTDYSKAWAIAEEEVPRAYLSIGPEMYPDEETMWTLIRERADALAEELTASQFAAMLGVSDRRVRAILESGAVEARKAGSVWLVPRYAAEEYARRERRPGRPRKGGGSDGA